MDSDDGGATINGVVFGTAGAGAGGLSGANYTLTMGGSLGNFQGYNSAAPATDGIEDLLEDFYFLAGTNAGSEVLTLTGLASGVQYKLRFYVGGWTSSTQQFTFDDTAVPTVVNGVPRNAGSDLLVGSIDYLYTLGAGDTDLVVSINADSDDASFHQYGFSYQVVPEPSTLVLVSVGLAGLVGMVRRNRPFGEPIGYCDGRA